MRVVALVRPTSPPPAPPSGRGAETGSRGKCAPPDRGCMLSDVKGILSLEVPLIVLLGERQLKVADVVSMATGSIIELPKGAEEELTVLVNNKPVGSGVAVKVGENFGIKITYMGDIKSRIMALGGQVGAAGGPEGGSGEDPAAMGAAVLAGAAAR